MANKLILKKSSTASAVPGAASLEIGELAVNLADKKLYSKNAGGTVITLSQPTTGTNAQLLANDGSGGFANVTTGAGLSYSGGTLSIAGGAYNPASVAITGGTINGTTIGATTPSTGAFTTLTASTSVTTPRHKFTDRTYAWIESPSEHNMGIIVGNNGTADGVVTFTNGSTSNPISITASHSAVPSKINFGSDTNLYRSSADTLKTDDALIVTGTTTSSSFLPSGTNGYFGYNDLSAAVYARNNSDAGPNLVQFFAAGSKRGEFSSTGLAVTGQMNATGADAANLVRIAGATGRFLFQPYFDATWGQRLFSLNTAESGYQPLSILASTIRLCNSSTVIAEVGSTGLAVTTASGTTLSVANTSSGSSTCRVMFGVATNQYAYINYDDTDGFLKLGTPSGRNYGVQLIVGGTAALVCGTNYTSINSGSLFVYGYGGDAQSSVIWQRGDQTSYIYHDGTNTTIRVGSNDRLILGSTVYCQPAYDQTTANAANMFVESNGALKRSTSSIRYKTDVRDYTRGLDALMSLRPVFYKGKSKSDEGRQFAGLIAEEVHDAGLTEFVQYDKDGKPDALAYSHMVALLVSSSKELVAELKALRVRVAALEASHA
jgi:hypothetical protein